jgi:hypothetical protein
MASQVTPIQVYTESNSSITVRPSNTCEKMINVKSNQSIQIQIKQVRKKRNILYTVFFSTIYERQY